ncbi:hypothetical protein BD560DRAFT_345523 [Blakeslea trispora]|nr:hypothetical protein BD560DRAFT_345523 [Blakeslea trispora]
MSKRDYYQILGVTKDATETDIKKAYRKLALEYHPDRNKDANAKQRFQQISEAFEILSSPQKRHEYDMEAPRFTQQYEFPSFAEDLFAKFFSNTSPRSSYSSASDDDDFFLNNNFYKRPDSFYHTPPSPPTTTIPKKPQSVKRSLQVSLDDLYTGTTKRLKVTRTLNHQTTDKILTVNVKPGSKSGSKIHFPGEGDSLPSGTQQDIEFEIQEKPHPVYTRQGDNLCTTLKITLLEALTGFKKSIVKLDGATIVTTSDGTRIFQTGDEDIILGEGMPKEGQSGERGDLVIRYQVDFPQKLTPKQRQYLQKALVA